jgi:lipopolysaccharide/colanic/teichoic acid biosynthesis glycosyltransferase
MFAHAHENRRSHAARFKEPQISCSFICQLLICVFWLISGGVLQASDPGQIVWKEQKGMMRSAEIGVVVWKEQPFHSDASSKAFAFSSMRQDDPITWFFNGAANKTFEKHELFQLIRFPQWPLGEIVEQQEFESLKFKLGELEAFAKKYPNAAVLLDGIAGSMRDAVSKFSSGKVYFSGNWIGREEYERLSQQRDETLKKYAKEREELERVVLQKSESKRKVKIAAKVQQWSTLILVAIGMWLLLLLMALLTRSWGTLSILVIALVAGAGWFTFTESGFAWTEYVVLAVRDLPSLLPFSK